MDKTYPLLCADIAINNRKSIFKSDIPHYLVVSSPRGDHSSIFLYRRVKGEFQRDVKLKKLNMLSIFNPGAIKNRPDARTAEKIAQFFSFLPFDQI